MKCCDMRMKENKIMKMISRRDFMKLLLLWVLPAF